MFLRSIKSESDMLATISIVEGAPSDVSHIVGYITNLNFQLQIAGELCHLLSYENGDATVAISLLKDSEA